MSDKLQDIIKKQSIKEEVKIEKEEQFICFKLLEEEFGINILNIQEILKPFNHTRVPDVPSFIKGVINMRGIVIPLIDLRLKFNLQEKKYDNNSRFIILNINDKIAGFIVDELTSSLKIKRKDIEKSPDTLDPDNTIVEGIGKEEHRIITLLKSELLLKKDF